MRQLKRREEERREVCQNHAGSRPCPSIPPPSSPRRLLCYPALRMRMRILTRYILREVTSHAVIGAAIFTFVLFTRDLGRILELVVRASAPLPSVAEIFLYTVPRPNQIGALLVEERSYGTKMYAAPWY